MIRRREPEMMDQPTLAPAEHEHALASLERINRLLAWNRRLVRCVRACWPEAMSVADVGSGGGGLLAACGTGLQPVQHRRGTGATESAAHRGLLIGVDRSRFALTLARRWHGEGPRRSPLLTKVGPMIGGVVADARRLPLADGSVDVVVSSLFLHHFDEPDAVMILSEAARVCRLGMLVGDLSRSPAALMLTWLSTRCVSRSRVFHVDGPRSVRAAFQPAELRELAERSGLAGARVQRCFPFRLVLVWNKMSGPHG